MPREATPVDIAKYHSDDYFAFLSSVNPESLSDGTRFNVSTDDCHVFEGLFPSFCRSFASCLKVWNIINDIVFGIVEFLTNHERVLYVDIDVHHRDGVEQAFFTVDRFMTVSFHKYMAYFPRTGKLMDIGLFRPIIGIIMEVYRPQAVVLECCFNLSIDGHAYFLEYLRSINVSLMWYETAVAVGKEISDDLPEVNKYMEYFCLDNVLHFEKSRIENENSPEKFGETKTFLLERLSKINHAPSV
ncbi:hypothetical protein MKW94_017171 [Papaver nudicaule]|uniref:Histone deacetylase domain-containing protein n=1 Tax=Papaver nudicaule TaxID=74823 RepID=A0AA42B4R5_PAPNU|nr:hypothetical protein [Papaver nudicaule]